MALAWPSHIHLGVAHEWFAQQRSNGWATCLITQSGLVRLSSNSRITPDAVSPEVALNLILPFSFERNPEYDQNQRGVLSR